jgi:hypothetical protein
MSHYLQGQGTDYTSTEKTDAGGNGPGDSRATEMHPGPGPDFYTTQIVASGYCNCGNCKRAFRATWQPGPPVLQP